MCYQHEIKIVDTYLEVIKIHLKLYVCMLLLFVKHVYVDDMLRNKIILTQIKCIRFMYQYQKFSKIFLITH